MHDWRELDDALGELLVGEPESQAEFEAGHLHGYEIAGDGYAGWIALRFEEFADGTMRAVVLGFKGRGVSAGLADLRRLLDQTPARRLDINVETVAHVRLYRMAGFDVEACRMTLEL